MYYRKSGEKIIIFGSCQKKKCQIISSSSKKPDTTTSIIVLNYFSHPMKLFDQNLPQFHLLQTKIVLTLINPKHSIKYIHCKQRRNVKTKFFNTLNYFPLTSNYITQLKGSVSSYQHIKKKTQFHSYSPPQIRSQRNSVATSFSRLPKFYTRI